MNNPLLNPADLAAFDAIQPAHVAPALDALLAEAEAALATCVSDATPADYDAMARVLDVATERLGRAWGIVSHLTAVADTPELRAAHEAALPRITEFFTRLGSDAALYAKTRTVAAQGGHPPARQRVLELALQGFHLGGADLQGQAKTRFAALHERLAQVAQQFSNHVLDATDAWADYASDVEMAGVPADVRAATREAAVAEGKDGHKLTLHMPCYLPIMQYADDRALRERLYHAYATRASEFGPAEQDNGPLMAEIMALRQEEAELLGYLTSAEVSLAPKMADTPLQVLAFLRDLARRARPAAERDMAELRAFAAEHLGLADLQAWDVPYASEKLKEARYAFSDEEVKAYFPLPQVLKGLLGIIETVFEVAIRPAAAPVWHASVQFYEIHRSGQLVGRFYLDPCARNGKRPGAWMDNARGRWLRPDTGTLQTPMAYLVCNFAPPVGDKPSLLTHDNVTTLFHEFGHGLHHLLTQVNELAVSGIHGVEWDAVELPSQFMENYCWEWEVVKHLSAHVDTGAPLPRALFDKMLAAKNFQSGMQTLRQVEFGLFDMRIHTEPVAHRLQAVLAEVRQEVAVVHPPAWNRMAHTFSHIFNGGYNAGYYSYKWAEVLSADAWSAFEETGPLDGPTGQRLRREIFEVGGSRPAIDSFKAFRGREPRIDALLRHQGMT
ncbi:MAG: M3 family metallopeptidase [Proteobacteria bacterium]|nr:M3 family metallopeptidase [Pseudomonadota bacterium]